MKVSEEDKLKAIRKGLRDAELENSTGFVSKIKIFKNKKKYTRKTKYKNYITTLMTS